MENQRNAESFQKTNSRITAKISKTNQYERQESAQYLIFYHRLCFLEFQSERSRLDRLFHRSLNPKRRSFMSQTRLILIPWIFLEDNEILLPFRMTLDLLHII